MNTKKIAGDVAIAFISQGISLVVSAFTALLVPKVLGVTGFGYWQLFLFYASYAGLFSLGLNDGVYLLLGGRLRDEADMSSLHGQFWVGMIVEGALAISICGGLALHTSSAERMFVLASTFVYIVVYNSSIFLGYTFQAFGETRLFSNSVLIGRLSFMACMVPLMLLNNMDFRQYVVAYLIAQLVGLIYCMVHARGLFSATPYGAKESISDSLNSIRVGSKLLLANLASMLILGVVRQTVDMRWGVEAFGQLSLSLSLVNFALAFVSQVGMVLFPALRRAGEDELRYVFDRLHSALALLLPASYLLMPILTRIVAIWLPAYAEGIGYLVWLMPMVVFDGQMSLLGTTYLKVLRMENTLLRLNIGAVAVSLIGAYFAVFVLGSKTMAVASAVAVIVIRSLIAEYVSAKRFGAAPEVLLSVGEVVITVVYLTLSRAMPFALSLVCYAIAYIVYLFVFRSKLLTLNMFVR